MALEIRRPSLICLFALILTAVCWEGLRLYGPRKGEGEGEKPLVYGPAPRADFILALLIFLILAAFFSWGFPYDYVEAAAGLILALVLMVRGILALMKALGRFFLFPSAPPEPPESPGERQDQRPYEVPPLAEDKET
jgi:hypothetical protein